MTSNPPLQENPLLSRDTVAVGLQARTELHAAPPANYSPLSPDSKYVYADGESICIENQGSLPLDRCILTNEPSEVCHRIPLRDAENPGTWWGKRPRLRVGLTRESLKRLRHGALLTWSSLTIGASIWGVGVFGTLNNMAPSISLPFYSAGSLLVLISGWFRAKASVSAPRVSREFAVINGAHPNYLEQFDQYHEGEFLPRPQEDVDQAAQGEPIYA
ncbi:MAG: hypothetical protein HKN23_12310 [Verrucomicrobiales bacterium]|nr:hypothetical protein [Verrucomicrobiales bacterium]